MNILRILCMIAIGYLVIGLIIACGFDTMGAYCDPLHHVTDPAEMLLTALTWPLFVAMALIFVLAAAANGC